MPRLRRRHSPSRSIAAHSPQKRPSRRSSGVSPFASGASRSFGFSRRTHSRCSACHERFPCFRPEAARLSPLPAFPVGRCCGSAFALSIFSPAFSPPLPSRSGPRNMPAGSAPRTSRGRYGMRTRCCSDSRSRPSLFSASPGGFCIAPTHYVSSVIVSGVLWSAAYALYALRYWPILTRPRIDGKPG